MKSTTRNLIGGGMLSLVVLALGGCAGTQQQVTVLKPVGPAAIAKHSFGTGDLVVYTPIEQPKINPDTMFYPHTAYAIYDSHGAFVQSVRNHLGAWDESPSRVALLPGEYTVKTEPEFGGDVVAPVVVRAGKTTVVNLEGFGPGLAGLEE